MGKEYRTFGPPGTGKTTWLTKRIRESVRKFGPEAVIVASFTRAAAVELAGRDLPLDLDKRVGTLHAFAKRACGNPTIADGNDGVKVWNSWVKFPEWKLKGKRMTEENPFSLGPEKGGSDGDKALSEYNAARSRFDPESSLSGEVRSFAVQWEQFKAEFEMMDFTDLILQVVERGLPPPVQARVGYFDEVQDFSPAELALVRHWGQFFDFSILAGDDDQCIYTFRGAKPEAFLDPPIPDDQKILLPLSYRLPRQIKDLADKYIRQVSRREEKEFRAREGAEGEVARLAVNYTEPELIVRDAIERSERGGTSMILGSCAYMLSEVIKSLREKRVLFHNPYRGDNGAWNPQSACVDRVLNYLRNDVDVWGEAARNYTWGDFYSWFEHVDCSLSGALSGAKRGAKAKGRPKGKVSPQGTHYDKTVTLDDWERLIGFDRPAVGDLGWLRDRLLTSQAGKYEYAFNVARDRGAKYLMETPLIVVGTIHSVKGGEADNVYLFPDVSYAAKKEEEQGKAGADAITRLMYVGMTRARERLVICEAFKPALGATI